MSWVRVEPFVGEAGRIIGNTAQVGKVFTATWKQDLGVEGTALVVRWFYRMQYDGGEYLECLTEYVLHAPTGITSKDAYDYCGEADSNSEVFIAAADAPEPTDEEWLAALAEQLAAA